MPQEKPIRVKQGCDWSGTLYLTDPTTGQPLTSYTSQDTPVATVWVGLQESETFEPTVAWIDPTQGTLSVAIAHASTANLNPGRYRLDVDVHATSGQVVNVFRGYLEVEPASGTAPTPGPIYSLGSYPIYGFTGFNLTDVYPSLLDEFGDADVTGFARQLSLARHWLDRAILAHDRGSSFVVMTQGGYSPVSSLWGGLGANMTNVWLKQQLSANKLMVTPLTAQIVNYHALGLILEAAIGPGDKESTYERKSREYFAKADALTATYVAELDLNADSYPDYVVDLGTCSERRF